MKLETPKRIATIGAVLISVSGVVNSVLGARIGAIVYDAYPGGRMGHVGIIAGVSAIAIGLVIAFIRARRPRRGAPGVAGHVHSLAPCRPA